MNKSDFMSIANTQLKVHRYINPYAPCDFSVELSENEYKEAVCQEDVLRTTVTLGCITKIDKDAYFESRDATEMAKHRNMEQLWSQIQKEFASVSYKDIAHECYLYGLNPGMVADIFNKLGIAVV